MSCDLDVAVVGGGPGGLAAANAILVASPGVRLRVFEAATEFKTQGSGVLMNINGINALKAISPHLHQRMKDQSVGAMGTVVHDRHGDVIYEKNMSGMFGDDFERKYGAKMFFLGWHEIRQTLFEALPPGVVEFGQKFQSYEDDGDAVRLEFEDAHEPVRAKLLIGADGYFSRVRRRLLDDGPPDFTQSVMWRARFPMSPDFDPARTMWWRSGEDFSDRFCGVFPISPDTLTLAAGAHVRWLEARGLPFNPHRLKSIQSDEPGSSALERCLKVFADFDERLLRILRATDPETVTEHGLYERPAAKIPVEGWGRGRVTLLGDAAHAGPPNGQGLNLSLEDGAVLGWHLRERGFSPAALRAFDAERVPRVREVLLKGVDSAPDDDKEHLIWRATFRPLHDNTNGSHGNSAVPAPALAAHRTKAPVALLARAYPAPTGRHAAAANPAARGALRRRSGAQRCAAGVSVCAAAPRAAAAQQLWRSKVL